MTPLLYGGQSNTVYYDLLSDSALDALHGQAYMYSHTYVCTCTQNIHIVGDSHGKWLLVTSI